ncbi:hypothetical protein [Methylocystis echinoides]|jgi:hypothetical protein|uniref:hypothetical protein n=1 Tax=Methylocystis echinoides TaxID=29468 RepID=UPI0034253079
MKDVLQETIFSWGWQDRIQHDPQSGSDFVTTIYIRHGEPFVYTLTVNEGRRKLGIHINSPIQIPLARKVEAIAIANYFNVRSTTGAYYITETGDLCYQWMLLAVGAEPTIGVFKALRDDANKAFDQTYTPFLTAAFTDNPASQIIEKLEFFWSKR